MKICKKCDKKVCVKKMTNMKSLAHYFPPGMELKFRNDGNENDQRSFMKICVDKLKLVLSTHS